MTVPGADSGDDDRIRAAAAAWLVRLDRKASVSVKRDLDRWLAADPRHAVAYRRVAGRFEGARVLRASRTYVARPDPVRRRRPVLVVSALAIIILALILVVPSLSDPSRRHLVDDHKVAATRKGGNDGIVRMTNGASGIKSVGLAEGSVVTLDAGTIVDALLTATSRRLTLIRGRARFTVAHDGRSFTVLAGGGSVLARGTIFDVSLAPSGAVGVSLLQGRIDVAPTTTPGATITRRLRQGEQIDYSAGSIVRQRSASLDQNVPWVVGAFEFDNVPLGYVLRAADHSVGPRIVMADASLAGLRVSGRFDTGDRSRLASNLARLFDLRVRVTKDVIELKSR